MNSFSPCVVNDNLAYIKEKITFNVDFLNVQKVDSSASKLGRLQAQSKCN